MSLMLYRIWLNIRALNFAPLINRRTMFGALAIFYIVIAIFSSYSTEKPSTQLQEQRADADALRTIRNKLNARLCDIEFNCAQYGIARQQCATAGNFDLCINVKTGDSIRDIGDCLPSGEMRNRPEGMPNKLQCIAHRIDKAFR